MPVKLLEGFSNKFAEQWVINILTPAFVFWAEGAIIAIQKIGWKNIYKLFTTLPEILQIGSLVGIFILMSISAFIVQKFDRKIIRLLEGYWVEIFGLLFLLKKCQVKRRKNLQEEFNKVNPYTDKTYNKYIRLDRQLQYYPTKERDILPTRLGNILRSAERRPLDQYGLDAIIIWPRLWILLPDGVRADLQAAYSDLNVAARAWLWSILCLVWVPFYATCVWWWWLLPIIVVAIALYIYYGWLLETAINYSNLIDAVFDLHRVTLYKSLRWKLPENSLEEKVFGLEITNYLWRGADPDKPVVFQPPN
jgi:hypothetical protein